jgi:hypothetical protein
MGDDYPSYAAENTKSEWDARQIYARDLQTLDMQANEIKMKLEMHSYKPTEIGEFLNCYLSYVRTMFRMLYFLFDKKAVEGNAEEKGITPEIEELKNLIGGVQQKISESMEYPQDIENRLEQLHNRLNGKRFERGLVVPMSMPRDDSGVDGWQGTG